MDMRQRVATALLITTLAIPVAILARQDDQSPESSADRLGPIAVTASSVDGQGWVLYTVASDLTIETPRLIFWRFEILRTYADGSRIVAFQESDFFENAAVGCIGVGSLVASSGSLPSRIMKLAHPVKEIGRFDRPIAVHVRPVTVLLDNGAAFGDRTPLDRIPARRKMLIADIQHWVRRIQRTQADYPGIVGVRYLIDELSTAQRVDETGIRVALKRFFDGAPWAVERRELDLTFALRASNAQHCAIPGVGARSVEMVRIGSPESRFKRVRGRLRRAA